MKKPLLFLAVFAFLALPAMGQGFNGEALALGWDAFVATELETNDGILYFAYVMGVVQGTDTNSTLFDHVPAFSMEKMAYLVGHYIEDHRKDDGFNQIPAAVIVTKALLERYPRPEVVGQNL